jgi:hypothetical protein
MAPCSLVFTNILYVPAASVARLHSGISVAKDAGIHLNIILTLEATIPNFHVSIFILSPYMLLLYIVWNPTHTLYFKNVE